MRAVARRGASAYLVNLSGAPTSRAATAQVYDASSGRLYPVAPVHAIVARGYWLPFDGEVSGAKKVDFFTEDGQVHPIRGSEGYDPELAGETEPDGHPTRDEEQYQRIAASRAAVAAAVAGFEKDILAKHPKIEWGRIFGKDGNPLTPVTKGSRTSIRWRGIPRDLLEGATMTHFHPTGKDGLALSANLSDTDVRLMLRQGMGTMRCFNAVGDYMEVRQQGLDPDRGWRFDNAFREAWREPRAAVVRDYRANADEPGAWEKYTALYAEKYQQAFTEAIGKVPGLTLRTGKGTP